MTAEPQLWSPIQQQANVPGHVPDCDAGETGRAVAAASRAFEDWSRRDLRCRAGLLHKLRDSLKDNRESLAQRLTAEQGKPLAEARGEITIGAA
ncbi:MAG: aldehyde dehydrogenase family protein [Boseongicola sp. SB0662_bin_57]|nr:aldehyde dehydrogenase family protein [Boseongicola sp. SB0662_bin_57]